jgi:hypothetical protein
MFGKKKQDAERKPIEQEIAELQKKFRVLENDKRIQRGFTGYHS